jgi:hypothetical protein
MQPQGASHMKAPAFRVDISPGYAGFSASASSNSYQSKQAWFKLASTALITQVLNSPMHEV